MVKLIALSYEGNSPVVVERSLLIEPLTVLAIKSSGFVSFPMETGVDTCSIYTSFNEKFTVVGSASRLAEILGKTVDC